MNFFKLFFFVGFVLLSGCSSLGPKLKSLINGGASEETVDEEVVAPVSVGPKFSDNPNLYTPVERQYRRMTQQRLEEEAEVHAKAGSLWSMEGQSSYLFSQNTSRQEGDLLNVELIGAAKNQIATKIEVIKALLARVEEESQRALASEAAEEAGDEKKEAAKEEKPQAAQAPGAEAEQELPISVVPTRIVERLSDGSYRVKGSQPFMIGKSQYKVIITGVVRAEDFNDDGVATEKLLDPQYDVVSLRRVTR